MTTAEQEKIYLDYRDKVMAYLSNRLNSREDAEDLCAAVFEKVLRNASAYDEHKASVSTWVFTITRNTLTDFFRTARSTEELPEELAEPVALDAELMTEETLDELASALAALPQDQRDIIVLHYYDGRPLTVVSEMTGIGYGMVKVKHRQALNALSRSMKCV